MLPQNSANMQITKPRQWHPAFYVTLQIELEKDSDKLSFENEHQLSSKPLEIDVLIIQKDSEQSITKNIGKIFRKHNIFEYKGPNDYLSIDDFYKAYGYTCFYKADVKRVNSIKIKEISLSFVSNGYPRKLMKHLKKVRNYEIHRKYRGIYYVTGDVLPIQFIIQNQLSEQENLWLKGLTDKLQSDGIAELLLKDYHNNKNNPLYETAMEMIVHSNLDKFEEVNFNMCRALEELFADQIEKKALEVADEKVEQIIAEKVDALAAKKAEVLAAEKAEVLAAEKAEALVAEKAEALAAEKVEKMMADNIINTLILRLSELNRLDDIVRSAKDITYQQQLLAELGLTV